MEFANDPIARRIREAAGRGTLSHALLFSGSGDRIAAAQYAAAAMECQGGGQKPCGTCPACRKVFSGIHPDVITVRDEAHKNLSVDTVRQIRADAYIRPNEGARKVYIFPDCTILTEQDQNVLLKIVEEGPPYAAFLFCAENSSVVLQTLRSRCVELKLHPAVTVEKESSEAGVELCRLLAAGKRGTVTELMVRLEKKRLDRDGREVFVGQTPLRALGATDQHSQLQLFMEGPADKVITFLKVEKFQNTVTIPERARQDCPELGYLAGVSFNQLMAVERWATGTALARAGRPSLSIALPEVTAYTLGGLLYFFEVATAFAGAYLNINAFDQPGVEAGKIAAYAYFGRPGYESQRQELVEKDEETKKVIFVPGRRM